MSRYLPWMTHTWITNVSTLPIQPNEMQTWVANRQYPRQFMPTLRSTGERIAGKELFQDREPRNRARKGRGVRHTLFLQFRRKDG